MKGLQVEIKRALRDPQLRVAMERFVSINTAARSQAYTEVDLQEIQERVRAMKEKALENLPELFARFKEEARRAGAAVFEAASAEDANRYILELAVRHGVRLAVKSKSMVSEETGLNRRLAEAGIRVVETDLGEWIVQLAGERPSHMVAPAIHKTREEVADLFSQVTGQPLSGAESSELVQVARRELRRIFLEAGMGITGANIAIAESGTLVLVTNEGNGRLVTLLPRLQVALVGYEKLVGTWEEAATILRILARGATGQKISSYVSLITGAVPSLEGYRQLHIVFLDNGRDQMRQDLRYREALYCIRCGACLSVCPPYRSVGGHVYGHIYVGGIGSILTAFYHGMEAAAPSLDLCIGCRACVEVCPAAIDAPRMIVDLRGDRVEQEGLPATRRWILRDVLRNRDRFHRALMAASWAQLPLTRGGPLIRHLPLFFSSQNKWRSLPAIALRPLRRRWTGERVPEGEVQARVAFYSGCLIDFAYPEMGEAVARVLRKEGLAVSFPLGQTCCGIPALYLGDRETACELAQQNIAALEEAGADYVITACPTCSMALRHEFHRLLAGDPVWEARAKAIAARAYDFSEFLVKVLGREGSERARGLEGRRGTYHDPCHLKRGLGVYDEPRELLVDKGLKLVEMMDSDTCCGFGGSYSLSYPGISRDILERKLKNLEATGAEVVATDCPGCVLQLRGGLDKKGKSIQVRHTAEILAEGLG
ncbi:MAG: LUD domain-containing protein [candidate division NC10 bacterium]|nr:LUD domain-containing protein [candidate division NC10 bacterium]